MKINSTICTYARARHVHTRTYVHERISGRSPQLFSRRRPATVFRADRKINPWISIYLNYKLRSRARECVVRRDALALWSRVNSASRSTRRCWAKADYPKQRETSDGWVLSSAWSIREYRSSSCILHRRCIKCGFFDTNFPFISFFFFSFSLNNSSLVLFHRNFG